MNTTAPRKPRLVDASLPPSDAIPEHIARLRAAIAEQRKAEAVVARLEEATSWRGADGRISTANRRVEQAEADLQAATRYEADRLVADATGDEPPTKPLTIREARDALADAETSLAALREARKELEDRLPQAQQSVMLRRMKTTDVARAAIAAELDLPQLVAAYEELRLKFWSTWYVLEWMHSARALDRRYATTPPDDLRAQAPWDDALAHAMETGEIMLPAPPWS